ncbi:MAG: DUF4325 domain-containing protein [Desulfovibrio desulfuricans]|nr:DUF4325 domain-containing protein [Desulfovibrio desulfuricans]
MKNTIDISDYGTVIVSISTADKIAQECINCLSNNDSITINFDGLISITSQCANAIISKIYNYIGKDITQRVFFKVTNDNINFILTDAMQYALTAHS